VFYLLQYHLNPVADISWVCTQSPISRVLLTSVSLTPGRQYLVFYLLQYQLNPVAESLVLLTSVSLAPGRQYLVFYLLQYHLHPVVNISCFTYFSITCTRSSISDVF